jgi:NH3-dependent NAD+ synthetase
MDLNIIYKNLIESKCLYHNPVTSDNIDGRHVQKNDIDYYYIYSFIDKYVASIIGPSQKYEALKIKYKIDQTINTILRKREITYNLKNNQKKEIYDIFYT